LFAHAKLIHKRCWGFREADFIKQGLGALKGFGPIENA
jgi:hypothetical protein